MKKLIGIYTSPRAHWVGDGFPVRTLFSYDTMGKHISPFLLLDHAGPAEFTPTEQRRGVGQHPHRGFETVTIVYDGEVEHRDSTGAGGKIIEIDYATRQPVFEMSLTAGNGFGFHRADATRFGE